MLQGALSLAIKNDKQILKSTLIFLTFGLKILIDANKRAKKM
jgi:hypothetical protein